MDNYFHPDVLVRLTGGLLNLPAGIDIDHVKMADELAVHLTAARANARVTGFTFTPDDHQGKVITKTNAGACKQIICCFFMRQMTAAEIATRASYQENGAIVHEVREWIDAIRAHL